eukprot:CAMPEP_0170536356 /NCGR_PEP_ID=MMETSP0209-20121228/102101_1 /TAXON_ID=665100 ORGANISM="Litonotus pictus, Strain P1" /NCGR_SAMPLE_ID=MMETSP0209 /ASSEMBLY_ACC=CAM_ASM_000301 /LENGTH=421 /DNA_ID=CAMNT_0010837713 /DNA_START=76 /DNA_END=1342 /DNA_ORIENTATION=+
MAPSEESSILEEVKELNTQEASQVSTTGTSDTLLMEFSQTNSIFTPILPKDKHAYIGLYNSMRLKLIPAASIYFNKSISITIYSEVQSISYSISISFVDKSLSEYNRTFSGEIRGISFLIPVLSGVEDYSFDLTHSIYSSVIQAYGRYSIMKGRFQTINVLSGVEDYSFDLTHSIYSSIIQAYGRYSIVEREISDYKEPPKNYDVSYSFGKDQLKFSDFEPFLEGKISSKVEYYTLYNELWLDRSVTPYSLLSSMSYSKDKLLTWNYKLNYVYILEGEDIQINFFAFDETSGILFEYGEKIENFFNVWYHWWFYVVLVVGCAVVVGSVILICAYYWDRIMKCLGCRRNVQPFVFNQNNNYQVADQYNNNLSNEPLNPGSEANADVDSNFSRQFNEPHNQFPSKESVDNRPNVIDINKSDSY